MNTDLKDSQVSMRLPSELKDRLETYARLTGRSKSHVAMEALTAYFDWRLPQIEDLKQAVDAADAGDLADPAEVQAVLTAFAPQRGTAAPAKRAQRRRA